MKRRTVLLLPIALISGAGLLAAACSDSTSSTPSPTDSGTNDSTTPSSDGAKESSVADGGIVSDADAAIVVVDSGLEAGNSESGPAETGPAGDAAPDAATDGAVEAAAPLSVVAIPGYTVSVFATGGTAYKGPDSLELDGAGHLWIGYQMGVVNHDGTDGGGPLVSQVVQYNLDGTLSGKSFPISGHCDGVRVDPVTHLVWATSNEDGNPIIVSWDPTTMTTKNYTLPVMPHGGGLDDMAFIDGKMFVTLSAPVADDAGLFSAPALAQVHVSGSAITLTPILYDNSSAVILPAADAGPTLLNMADPDSLSIDDKGQLVLIAQGDNQLVFLKNPGGTDAGAQSVTVLPVFTQLDDTVWAKSASGYLLVADANTNTIYTIRSNFTPGTIFTETPNDSTIPGIVGIVDATNGFVKPVVINFGKPTGMIFVP
ncbi:MAG: hypothetical protein M3O50_01860 [Myxococcota bacterium]|nr:hypothetical protein [Myxococcota bacterium]